ncbi:MAG: hypothetical protein LQ340_002801 [Diploschistes diacapsis]|nr:MAG: hypothetical protein LQ340_002801 [Diploschistes diacapsis]
MVCQALITRPLGPPCSFGGPLALPPVRGMLAMLAFQAARGAMCYFLSSQASSAAGGQPVCGFWPPWMCWSTNPPPGNGEGCPLQAKTKPQGICAKESEATGTKMEQLALTGKVEASPAADSTQITPKAQEQAVIPGDPSPYASAPAPAPAPASSSTSPSSPLSKPLTTLASLTPILQRALPNLRMAASSLQSLLAANEKLAAAPATGYIREALTAFVWVCDVVEVLGGLAGAG